MPQDDFRGVKTCLGARGAFAPKCNALAVNLERQSDLC
jgi:hypothetical protein